MRALPTAALLFSLIAAGESGAVEQQAPAPPEVPVPDWAGTPQILPLPAGTSTATGGAAPGTLKLLVTDLIAEEGVSRDVANVFTDLLIDEVGKLKRFDVVGQRTFGKSLAFDQEQKLKGCVEARCVEEVALAAGVEYAIGGTVGQLGVKYLVALRVTNLKRGKVLKVSTKEIINESAAASVLELMVSELVKGPGGAKTSAEATTKSVAKKAPAPLPPFTPAAAPAPMVKQPYLQAAAPEVKAKPGAPEGPRSHAGMISLQVSGYLNDHFDGGAFDLAMGYAPIQWLEVSFGAGSGMYPLIRPRVTVYPYRPDGVLKPLVRLQSTMVFSNPVAVSFGGAVGVLYDFHRRMGICLEIPVEYFPVVPANREATVVLFSAGFQVRL